MSCTKSHVLPGMHTPVVAIGNSSNPECKRMGQKEVLECAQQRTSLPDFDLMPNTVLVQ